MTFGAPTRGTLIGVLLMALSGCASPDLGSMRLDRIAELGNSAGPGALPTWPRVSPHHPGGFWIVVPQPGSAAFQPVVFDDGGNLLGELTAPESAREGFVQPLFARIAPDSSIWIFDAARRALVFSPTRAYLRTVPLPIAPWDAAILSDGRIAITSSAYAAPLPWILIDQSGRELLRAGTPIATDDIQSPRQIFPGTGGTLWTVTLTYKIRLEHWDSTGTLLNRFEPSTDWFTWQRQPDTLKAAPPPEPSLQGGWIAPDGKLWLVGKAVDPAWKSHRATTDPTLTRQDQEYDTVFEIRDPTNGGLLESGRVDPSYPFVVEPGVVMRPTVIEGGWFRAELAEVKAVTPTARKH